MHLVFSLLFCTVLKYIDWILNCDQCWLQEVFDHCFPKFCKNQYLSTHFHIYVPESSKWRLSWFSFMYLHSNHSIAKTESCSNGKMKKCDNQSIYQITIVLQRSSLISNTSATRATRMQQEYDTRNTIATRVIHEQHECDTSATRVLHKWHECDSSAARTARVKNLDFVTTGVKTCFHTLIFTIWHAKDYKEKSNFKNYFLEISLFHVKMRLKSEPQKLIFLMEKATSKSCTPHCSYKCPCTFPHSYAK